MGSPPKNSTLEEIVVPKTLIEPDFTSGAAAAPAARLSKERKNSIVTKRKKSEKDNGIKAKGPRDFIGTLDDAHGVMLTEPRRYLPQWREMDALPYMGAAPLP